LVKDQDLLTVFDVAWLLAARQPLHVMLPKFLSSMVERWGAADAGFLMLYDPADGRLWTAAAQGYDLEKIGPLRVAPGEGISGHTFRTRQSQVYGSPEAVNRARANMSPKNRSVFQSANIGAKQPLSAVAIPMLTDNMNVGVLILESFREANSFREEDIPFFARVTDVLSLAVANALRDGDVPIHQGDMEVDHIKEDLISTLAHEMRTPLTSIKGYATALLMEDLDFAPDMQQEFLQLIDEECDTLQYLIHDFLESSNIGAGLLNLEIQPVLLDRLIRNVTDDMKHMSPKHRFMVDLPAHMPIVDADPDRIVQVLRNLLDNAVKYSPEGGLVLVRGEVWEQDVAISVADEGIGIAPDDLNRLFDKFFRAKSREGGHHVVGSGLGLPIARTIVESHGGRIWAESQVGQGTTLVFTIPLREFS
jgi:signal transduction histidine kinase